MLRMLTNLIFAHTKIDSTEASLSPIEKNNLKEITEEVKALYEGLVLLGDPYGNGTVKTSLHEILAWGEGGFYGSDNRELTLKEIFKALNRGRLIYKGDDRPENPMIVLVEPNTNTKGPVIIESQCEGWEVDNFPRENDLGERHKALLEAFGVDFRDEDFGLSHEEQWIYHADGRIGLCSGNTYWIESWDLPQIK